MAHESTQFTKEEKTSSPAAPIKLSKNPPKWLNSVMKFGSTTDFFVLAVLIVYHIKQHLLPEDEALWPIRQAYALHSALVIINGLASTWKGWSVDNNAFYALHHAITHVFFYYTTAAPSNTSSKYLAAMFIYLFMRIFKRLKDEGLYTDKEWVVFYVLYTYTQTITSLFFTLWIGHEHKPIDIIGYIALVDSAYTSRRVDISKEFFGGLPIFVTDNALQRPEIRKLLSILDVVIVWAVTAIPLYQNAQGGNGLSALTNIDSYRSLLAFGFVDLIVKRIPAFKKFKRPHVYDHMKSGSFPSAHAAVAVVSCQTMDPLTKVVMVAAVGFSRVSSRSHTPEDVCAGYIFGDIFNVIWIIAMTLIGK